MIIEWINYYYKYFVLLFLVLAIVKIFASLAIQKNTAGLIGIIIIIFQWYSKHQMDLTDSERHIKYMRLLNFISILVYFSLFVLGSLTLIKKLF